MANEDRNKAGAEALSRMYRDGFSLTEISEMTGTPTSTVRNRLIRAGVTLRSKHEGILNGVKRGKWATPRKSGPVSEQARANIRAGRQAWGEANAVGIRVSTNGYAEFTRGPNKGKSVHAVVMEAWIGRPLTSKEHVHHIDGDKLNNVPDNLALMTVSGHIRLHRLQDEMSGNTRQRNEKGMFA